MGIVAAGELIPLAEETGLIVTIGDWVLERSVSTEQGLAGRRSAVDQVLR